MLLRDCVCVGAQNSPVDFVNLILKHSRDRIYSLTGRSIVRWSNAQQYDGVPGCVYMSMLLDFCDEPQELIPFNASKFHFQILNYYLRKWKYFRLSMHVISVHRANETGNTFIHIVIFVGDDDIESTD